MKGLDTNLLVRYLVQDDAAQYRTAKAFLHRHCTPDSPGFINKIVLCELVWVLEKFYDYRRSQIADTLDALLRSNYFLIDDANAARDALHNYRSSKADYADCLIGKINRRAGYGKIATFDKDAAKLAEFELVR